MWSRLIVEVEGATEENFVNLILSGHLYGAGYEMVAARLLGNPRHRKNRGGVRPWPSVANGITSRLKEDSTRVVTTFVDYYGMPLEGDAGWPGRKHSASLDDATQKGAFVEQAMANEIAGRLGPSFDRRRFVPFTMVHEFEALLFSNPAALAKAIGQPHMEGPLREIRQAFSTPAAINDSPETAPSKRIEKLIPKYQKPLSGLTACREIGLHCMRAECPHFDAWLTALERLPQLAH